MKEKFAGQALALGNNIDTDQIYPGRYLALTNPEEIGSHCLEGVDEGIARKFPKGGIIVAGTNFGCGSSREHAAIALLNMGAGAVVANPLQGFFTATPLIWAFLCWCARVSEERWRAVRTWKSI